MSLRFDVGGLTSAPYFAVSAAWNATGSSPGRESSPPASCILARKASDCSTLPSAAESFCATGCGSPVGP